MPSVYERLQPAGPPVAAEDVLFDAALGSGARADRPYVFMNFVATADGRATQGGDTRALGGDADLAMLLALRTVADAVLVGTGTVRVEGYGRLVGNPQRRERRVAAGLAPDPPAVLIARRFDIPWEAGLFAAPEQPVLIYTPVDGVVPPEVAAPVELVRLDPFSSTAALADLRRRGVRALLSEGGPTLFRGLLGEGLVDELFLTLAPLLTAGDGERQVLSGPSLDAPAPLSLQWILSAEDGLFVRYRIGSPG
jgi:riboflavin biosynthesis pyrimidine reductase